MTTETLDATTTTLWQRIAAVRDIESILERIADTGYRAGSEGDHCVDELARRLADALSDVDTARRACEAAINASALGRRAKPAYRGSYMDGTGRYQDAFETLQDVLRPFCSGTTQLKPLRTPEQWTMRAFAMLFYACKSGSDPERKWCEERALYRANGVTRHAIALDILKKGSWHSDALQSEWVETMLERLHAAYRLPREALALRGPWRK